MSFKTALDHINSISTLKNVTGSENAKNTTKTLFSKIASVFGMDPIAAVELIGELKNFYTAVRDENFFEYLETYVLNLNE